MRTIRLAKAADGQGVAEIYAPVVKDTAISFEVDPPGADEMGARIAATTSAIPWLVCVEGDRVDGYVYASRFNERAAYGWSVNVTCYVREGRRRAGIGRGLYTALLPILHAQGIYAAHAGITLPNDASVGLHESFGMRRVALYSRVGFKLGAWHDVGWWQVELRERTGTPDPILPMVGLMRLPAWREAIAAGERVMMKG
ncbi:MAG TPA: arsinothricin resistance N-acetyltransferase ArsN1 family B [Polyangiaceae bacterium]|jgi:phosphinothricin acetyltransferase|nr:arsinothricin resistance N-acetyltransferase ArsN1 family B [Polyangiaceae bacterium]